MEFRDKPMENLMRLQEKDICKNVNALLLEGEQIVGAYKTVRCLLYTSPSPRDAHEPRMPSSA